jgi:16S rRNA (uracil1498-N3)-methyltransferase
MHHFFVSPALLEHDPIVLRGPHAHQIARVLRMPAGAHIVLLDNSGLAYEVEIDSVSAQQIVCRLARRFSPQSEPRLQVSLYQALTHERKFDWVLQKATELGVAAITPLYTARAVVPERKVPEASKLERWQKIATEAAEQSGRARFPQVHAPVSLAQALESLAPDDLALMAAIGASTSVTQALEACAAQQPQRIALFIGPEGGFEAAETALARARGVTLVSLGPRVLRTETAGLVALTLLMHAAGEFG